jgi:hypothetical protein
MTRRGVGASSVTFDTACRNDLIPPGGGGAAATQIDGTGRPGLEQQTGCEETSRGLGPRVLRFAMSARRWVLDGGGGGGAGVVLVGAGKEQRRRAQGGLGLSQRAELMCG